MDIALRCDGNSQIGSGHLSRCLTLALALREKGASCSFICREHSRDMAARIVAQGFEVLFLSEKRGSAEADASVLAHADWLGTDWQADADQTITALGDSRPDWLIVDHYALDTRWESTLRPYCGKIMVIDDLADRRHDCDLLLDQTHGINSDKYFGLLPKTTKLLLGSSFALLRTEFSQFRSAAIVKRLSGHVKNLLISLGGGDNTDYLIASILALNRIPVSSIENVTVILGNEDKSSIEGYLREVNVGFNLVIETYSTKMGEHMLWADLAIGAGGSTSWERCCLALPSIVIEVADNQKQIAYNLQQSGAAIAIFKGGDLNAELEKAVTKLLVDQKYYQQMASKAAIICDGKGVILVTDNIFYGTTI